MGKDSHDNHKALILGQKYPINFDKKGGQYRCTDLGGLMKLFNQFNVLPRYLTAFNYAGLNLNETPKELEKCTPEFQNFWEKECREHPTNQNCLIYCD